MDQLHCCWCVHSRRINYRLILRMLSIFYHSKWFKILLEFQILHFLIQILRVHIFIPQLVLILMGGLANLFSGHLSVIAWFLISLNLEEKIFLGFNWKNCTSFLLKIVCLHPNLLDTKFGWPSFILKYQLDLLNFWYRYSMKVYVSSKVYHTVLVNQQVHHLISFLKFKSYLLLK